MRTKHYNWCNSVGKKPPRQPNFGGFFSFVNPLLNNNLFGIAIIFDLSKKRKSFFRKRNAPSIFMLHIALTESQLPLRSESLRPRYQKKDYLG